MIIDQKECRNQKLIVFFIPDSQIFFIDLSRIIVNQFIKTPQSIYYTLMIVVYLNFDDLSLSKFLKMHKYVINVVNNKCGYKNLLNT